MDLFAKLDTQALQKYYDTKNFEDAKELLKNYYSRGNKDLVNYIGRVTVTNVDSIRNQPKFANYDINKPLSVGLSKLTIWFMLIGCAGISGLFGYTYFDNGQVITTHLVVSMISFLSILFCVYILGDNRAKIFMNKEEIRIDYDDKDSIKWTDILIAFNYFDPGSPSVCRLLIYTKKSIKPLQWNINFLDLTNDEIAFVFNKYLQNVNEN